MPLVSNALKCSVHIAVAEQFEKIAEERVVVARYGRYFVLST